MGGKRKDTWDGEKRREKEMKKRHKQRRDSDSEGYSSSGLKTNLKKRQHKQPFNKEAVQNIVMLVMRALENGAMQLGQQAVRFNSIGKSRENEEGGGERNRNKTKGRLDGDGRSKRLGESTLKNVNKESNLLFNLYWPTQTQQARREMSSPTMQPRSSSGRAPLSYVPTPTRYSDSEDDSSEEVDANLQSHGGHNKNLSDQDTDDDDVSINFPRRVRRRRISYSSTSSPEPKSRAPKPEQLKQVNKKTKPAPILHTASHATRPMHKLGKLSRTMQKDEKGEKVATLKGTMNSKRKPPNLNLLHPQSTKQEPMSDCETPQPRADSQISRQPMSLIQKFGGIIYKCPGCGMTGDRKSNVSRHIKMTCKEFVSEKKRFQCSTCSLRFSRPDTLAEHHRNHHTTDDQYIRVCPICKKNILGRQKFNEHKRRCDQTRRRENRKTNSENSSDSD